MTSVHIVRGLRAFRRPQMRVVVTVGVFDGVHRAHQRLIRSTVQMARRLKAVSVAITFDPDPQVVLQPARTEPALMSLDERLIRLRQLGVDVIWVIPFTKRFARMTAEQFVRRILLERLNATALIVGETFVFGRNRRGDMSTLQAVGSRHGMRVIPMPQVTEAGEPISSSRVRRLIACGKLAMAKRLLGRPPSLFGVVVRGAGRGARLGFPTANIRLHPQVLPPPGVYAVLLQHGARRVGRGVMNLGVRPTFGPGPLTCEVHVLGFSGRLVNHSVSVSLLARLRHERCFPSPEALRRQVRLDIIRARQLLSRLS